MMLKRRAVFCPGIEAHEITDLLAQGRYPKGGFAVAKCNFRHLVLCALELQDDSRFRAVQVHKVPFDDSLDLPKEFLDRLYFVARDLSKFVRRREKMLVTCHMGLNRSGLMSALLLHHAYGLSGIEAVNRVRTKRPNALGNHSFVDYLRRIPSKR